MDNQKVLVTGAAGFIGSKLALKLAESGIKVRALYHSKINSSLQHNNIELIQGDILDKKSLEKATEGCHRIFHVAALANPWSKNPQLYYDINVIGTENIIEAGKKSGVKKIVVTSTAGTIGPSLTGSPVTEAQIDNTIHFGHYEKSKADAEKKIFEFVKNGMNIVIVNPTRVFGPGELSKSNLVTKIIQMYIQRKWKFRIGNGQHIGNYAFVDDVVNGHILAMEMGRVGERYLLGGHNISFNRFIEIISEASGIRNNLVPVPLAFIGAYAIAANIFSGIFGTEPKFAYSFVKKYKANWNTSIEKSERELGYIITPTKIAVEKTIEWFKIK